MMVPIVITLVALILTGCATASQPPPGKSPGLTPHAEAGVGLTLWKIPVAGIGFWFPPGIAGGLPVVIHQYTYQAMPPKAQYGVPAQPPGPPAPVAPPEGEKQPEQPVTVPAPPPPVIYRTVYPPAPFDDPTLIVFRNVSERAIFQVSVDGGKSWLELPPGQATPDIHLGPGDHRVRVRGKVGTVHHGWLDIPERIVPLRVEARGRAQIIHLHEF